MENTRYPVSATAKTDEKLSRLLIFVKWLLAFPHNIITSALVFAVYFLVIIAWFAILFTGRYPRALFNFVEGTFRWCWRVNMYGMLITDKYPPFSLDPVEDYPAKFSVQYPERLSRLLIFVKIILIIPSCIVLGVLLFVSGLFWILGWFAILFTGHFPSGMANFVIGTSRWMFRVYAYCSLMTDAYPPFSLEE